MEIMILNTFEKYHKMLELPNKLRVDFFHTTLLAPFEPMFQRMQMPANSDMMGCMPLSGNDDAIHKMLQLLLEADAWNAAIETLQRAALRFQSAGIPVPDKVIVGIFPGNPEMLAHGQGYTGFGGIPGYIQIIIAPNAFNLPKLQSCIAHEFHHNVLFHNAKWSFMNVTTAKYLVVEGLAESFAVSMFGEDFLGPWVTGVQDEDLEKSRRIIGNALDAQGFLEVRKYMFGDHPMLPASESVGIPYCGGYAVGFHAVQAFLKNTGMSIEEATIIDGETIMEQSGYFNSLNS